MAAFLGRHVGSDRDQPGRVAVWDAPRRIVFDGGDPEQGLVFEWTVEASSDSTCTVKLVNGGFDNDYHQQAMEQGWLMFLANLQLHCAHFRGQTATASLPMAQWAGPRDAAWNKLTSGLGIATAPAVGDRIDVTNDSLPSLGGTVVAANAHRISLLVDTPAPGTAFLAAEGHGDDIQMSTWTYLYGEDGAAASARDEPIWRQWFESQS